MSRMEGLMLDFPLTLTHVMRRAETFFAGGEIVARLDAEPGRWDLSAMKAMLVGGSAVPRAMIAAFEERHGLKICQGWGMTETSPVASTPAISTSSPPMPATER